MADEDERDEPEEGAEHREARWGFSRLGEQLSGLLDPEAALRRGQGIVTGVTQATKDEMMRIISGEVRSFLDGMDIADLAQQVISGLVVDVNMQVRFSRSDDGLAQPTVTRNETKIRTRREADDNDKASKASKASKNGDAESSSDDADDDERDDDDRKRGRKTRARKDD